MRPALQALTVALLVGWPFYNLAMALVALRTPALPPARPGAAPRQYWIMIPALNEAKVIANTVTAALGMTAPGCVVRVLVVDDGSDDATPAILAALRHPRLVVLRRNLPDARRGKGEALNAGYRAIRAVATREGTTTSTVVGIIDGDGRADPALLGTVDAMFADRGVGAVQCRVRIHNRRRMLGLLQDVEFGCIAHASQTLRDRLGCVGMGGNGQFTRLGELARLGDAPWTGCLVEDLELGLRLHLAGVRIRYCGSAAITQQAVVDLPRLLRQRARWAQGNLQCALHLRTLLRSRHIGTAALLDLTFYLGAPWLTVPLSLVVGAVACLTVAGLALGWSLGGLLAGNATAVDVAVWVGAVLLPGTVWGLWHRWRIGEEPVLRCLAAGLGYPLFVLVGIVATWRGLLRHVTGRNAWDKTERLAEAVALPPAAADPAVPAPGVPAPRRAPGSVPHPVPAPRSAPLRLPRPVPVRVPAPRPVLALDGPTQPLRSLGRPTELFDAFTTMPVAARRPAPRRPA